MISPQALRLLLASLIVVSGLAAQAAPPEPRVLWRTNPKTQDPLATFAYDSSLILRYVIMGERLDPLTGTRLARVAGAGLFASAGADTLSHVGGKLGGHKNLVYAPRWQLAVDGARPRLLATHAGAAFIATEEPDPDSEGQQQRAILTAVTVEAGEKLWQTRLQSPEPQPGSVVAKHGLLLYDGWALSLADGKVRWTVEDSVIGFHWDLNAPSGELEGWYHDQARVIDAASGRVLRRYGYLKDRWVTTPPIRHAGLMLVGTDLGLVALGASGVSEKYQVASDSVTAPLQRVGELVWFLSRKAVHTVDIATGGERCRFQPPEGAPKALLVVGDVVVVTAGFSDATTVMALACEPAPPASLRN